MAQSGISTAPPYVSFKTFLSFLDWPIEDNIELPNQLDRSFWSKRMSGSRGPQLMGALRFLYLVDENNRPLSDLEEMVQDQTLGREIRKRILRQQLQKCYEGTLHGLDLEKTTSGQLEERFRKYSITGETLRKAVAFFIQAAEYCGIPLHSHISKKTRSTRNADAAKKRIRRTGKRVFKESLSPSKTNPDLIQQNDLHPSLQGLLADLRREGSIWSEERRDEWIDTFVRTVKYAYSDKRIREGQLDMELQ
ncbi:hypothetical protein ACFLXE_08285 [Chloroflexota bacterium]